VTVFMKHRLALVVAIGIPTALPATLPAQGTAYDVPGISAWTTGKTYGFTFSPETHSGESVSRPLDGMNTRLTRSATVLLVPQTVTVAQVVGGQPSVNPGERNTTFRMFGGRTLQAGWTLKSVDVSGNFTYVSPPRPGTNDLSFRVLLAPGGSATLRKLVLNGPAGADWKDAFSSPVRTDYVDRKNYVINGVVAWNAAKKYGFTFTPLAKESEWGGFVSGLPDGVYTALIATPLEVKFGWPCTDPPGQAFVIPRTCVVGQIVGGNMSVTVPINPGQPDQSVAFEMFGAKRLSPGWIVKSVSISGASWTRQPAYGSEHLSFVLRVTSHANNSASAIVKSITLEGPSNATSFEDAFKNAQSP
jgi:hypothetical protein